MEEYDERLIKEQNERRQLADECLEENLQRLMEGDLKAAEEMGIRAKDIYEELGDTHNLANTLNRLYIVYNEMGNETMSIKYMLDALDIVADGDDYEMQAKMYNNLGSEYMELKSYENALKFFEKASEMFELACEKDASIRKAYNSLVLILNLNMSATYYKMGDIVKSKYHYEIAQKASLEDHSAEYELAFVCYESLILWKMGEQEKVKSQIDDRIETIKAAGYATDYVEALSDVVDLLKEMKDYERWEQILNVMENGLSDDSTANVRLEILKKWIDYYKLSGDTEKYAEYCIKFFEATQERTEAIRAKKAEDIELQWKMRVAAKQKKIEESMVYLDPLTGIGNRNKMLEDSENYLSCSVADKSFIAVGLVDIDFFKECNDTYGHIYGDKCLKRVASVIDEAVGEAGNVYRYGGDEFLILLPGVSKEDILALGEKIKEKLDEEQLENKKSSVVPYVTVSQGYTRAVAEPGDNIDSLVSLVDKVMYAVKRSGRNGYRYETYSDIINGKV